MGEWKSIERRLLLDAALELMEAVEALPHPVREVLLAVAVTGKSVRAAARTLRHRASFSVAADYALGLRMLWSQSRSTVERIA